jgi:hypothetical protein
MTTSTSETEWSYARFRQPTSYRGQVGHETKQLEQSLAQRLVISRQSNRLPYDLLDVKNVIRGNNIDIQGRSSGPGKKLQADTPVGISRVKGSIATIFATQTCKEHIDAMQFVRYVKSALSEERLESTVLMLKDMPAPANSVLVQLRSKLMNVLSQQQRTIDSLGKMLAAERGNVRKVVIATAVILAGLASEVAWVLFMK